MQKRVLFFNNDVTYFFIHRKKFVNYFLNHNYKVIYSFPTKEKQKLEEYMQKNNEILEGQISFYNLKKRSLNILNELITIFSIFKLILISKPLIIYTTTVKLGLYIILVNNFFRKKIIINFSGLGYLYVKKNIYVIILRKFIEFIFKFSYHNKSIFIFENNEDLKYFTENKKIFPLQRCLCLNGVGVDIQKFQYIKKNIKTSYNVLMVARIEYEKGVFDYLKAIKELKNNNQFSFILVGKIPDNKDINLLKLLDECKTFNNFKYFSWIDDMTKLYSKIDVGVLTSYREGMSVFLMESLSSGIPLIVTDIPSNRQIVQDNYNGYLVSLNSPIQIVEKLYEITKNYNNYLSMSKNARNLCEKNFDEEIILSKYEKKLDYILN